MANYIHPSSLPNANTIIKADNLHKTYLFGLEGVAALRGVSFDIKQGDFIIILGNSGGGKTSLLNILGTIDKQTKVPFYSPRAISNFTDKKSRPKPTMKSSPASGSITSALSSKLLT
jgi:ABC-type phosphate/phosphonate transport system ATPase subunit